jgi:hypothetical protein
MISARATYDGGHSSDRYVPGTPPGPGKYVHRYGTLANGGDAAPAATLTIDKGLDVCTATPSCTGISFGSDEPRPSTTAGTFRLGGGYRIGEDRRALPSGCIDTRLH